MNLAVKVVSVLLDSEEEEDFLQDFVKTVQVYEGPASNPHWVNMRIKFGFDNSSGHTVSRTTYEWYKRFVPWLQKVFPYDKNLHRTPSLWIKDALRKGFGTRYNTTGEDLPH